MSDAPVQPSPQSPKQAAVERALRVMSLGRQSRALFPPGSQKQVGMLVELAKAVDDARTDRAASNQGETVGEKPHPFDFDTASQMLLFNIHHATCVYAKVQAMVGLGHFVETPDEPAPTDPLAPQKPKKRKPKPRSKVSIVLDPLCKQSWPWLQTMLQVVMDYVSVGIGYLEIVRDARTLRVVGIHYLPASRVWKVVESDGYHHHFVHRTGTHGIWTAHAAGKLEHKMAAFGDSKRLLAAGHIVESPRQTISEVIEFPEVSSLSRWYGFPSWLAATASIELVQALMQHQFDFHQNRGVPEFLLFFLGSKLAEADWSAVEETLQSFSGLSNSGKSSAFNFLDEKLKVQVERMNMEGITQGTFFRDMNEALAQNIVTAHQVPPSIGGVLLPGKMGAANEASNAIMSFQALKVGPAQTAIQTILGNTLGSTEAGLGLTMEDFAFKTIVDEMAEAMEALKPADTMGRMKESLPAAQAEGRDLAAGLKKAVSDKALEVVENLLVKMIQVDG